MRLFGFFDKGRKRESSPSSGGGSYKDRAVYVGNETQAMKISAVYRAVDLISSSIAVLPFEYKRKDFAMNYFKPYYSDALYNILLIKPNNRQTSFILMKNLISQVLLLGNAYAYTKRDQFGYPQELILLSPRCCQYEKYGNKYIVNDSVNKIFGTYQADEILHFKNASLDGGYCGVSTITLAAETLGIAATASKETLERFATGGKIKGILHNEDDTTVKGIGNYDDEELKSAADKIQQSLDEGKDIISMPGNGKLDQLSLSSVDMQFLESRKFTITEIARFFNVPKSKLFDDSNANYKSSEMSSVEFYSDCLAPIMTMIENEFRAKLIPLEYLSAYKFSFNVAKLYTTDLTTKANYQTKQIANGIQTVNDIRREEDLPPVDGGDTVFISCNVAPIDSPKISGVQNMR